MDISIKTNEQYIVESSNSGRGKMCRVLPVAKESAKFQIRTSAYAHTDTPRTVTIYRRVNTTKTVVIDGEEYKHVSYGEYEPIYKVIIRYEKWSDVFGWTHKGKVEVVLDTENLNITEEKL